MLKLFRNFERSSQRVNQNHDQNEPKRPQIGPRKCHQGFQTVQHHRATLKINEQWKFDRQIARSGVFEFSGSQRRIGKMIVIISSLQP